MLDASIGSLLLRTTRTVLWCHSNLAYIHVYSWHTLEKLVLDHWYNLQVDLICTRNLHVWHAFWCKFFLVLL